MPEQEGVAAADLEPSLVLRAVKTWTGWGDSPWPKRDDAAVLECFGDDPGARLVRRLRTLEEDFYRSDAHLTAPDLATMGAESAEEFRARHPEVPADVAAAFSWCYTFDYR